MVKLRPAVGMALIWLATVVGVSATAWVAIDQAGRDISGAGASSSVSAALNTAVATTTPTSVPTLIPTTPAPSASTTPPTSTSTTSTASSTPASPPASSTTATVSSPTPRDKTVMVTGGQVSIRCIGTDVSLRIAQPSDGWRVEVERASAGAVEVRFKRGGEDNETRTNVKAGCPAGNPAFTVTTTG